MTVWIGAPQSPIVLCLVGGATDMYKQKYGFVHINPKTVVSTKIMVGKLRNAIANYSAQQEADFSATKYDKTKHLSLLLSYDFKVSGRNRASSVPAYLDMSVSSSAIALPKNSHNSVVGMCCISCAGNGNKFGPLYAENMSIALTLLEFLLREIKAENNDVVSLNVPETNQDFFQFVKCMMDDCDEGLVFRTSYTQLSHVETVDWGRVYCPMSIQPDC